jgi:hypothetical protein
MLPKPITPFLSFPVRVINEYVAINLHLSPHYAVGATGNFTSKGKNSAGYLVDETNTHCAVPIFPLVPHRTAKEVVPTTARMLTPRQRQNLLRSQHPLGR